MITCLIKGKTFLDAEKQIEQASKKCECLEFRCDLFDFYDVEKIKALKEKTNLPVIFTYRTQSQGGEYKGEENQRLNRIKELASLYPEYIDLEYDVEDAFINEIRKISPKTRLIVSYHNFQDTPKNLFQILEKMQKPFRAIYKMACMANTSIDLLRMMNFLKKTAPSQDIVTISMGECGIPSRVMARVLGSFFCYTTLDQDTSSLAQISVQDLFKIYHVERLTSKSQFFAVIGDPISKSPGPVFHNQYFKDHHLDHLYFALKIPEKELAAFFQEIKTLPFKGLSVTMPLKQDVMSYLNEISEDAKKIGALNTLHIKKEKIEGFNTDAPGALNAIEKKASVKGKKMIVIGAGGSARAIAFEAHKRGAHVFILNRTEKKAKLLAKDLNCKGYALDAIKDFAQSGYDILIHTTSVGMLSEELVIEEKYILENALIMDIVHGENTPLLVAARKKKCSVVYGFEMFENQALLQQEIWS